MFLGLATPLRADEATGAATTSIPITVPPGRNNLTPAINVEYASNRGNGLFGIGWRLSLGVIRRSTRNGVPFRYDADPQQPFHYPLPGDGIGGDGHFLLEVDGAQTRLDTYLGASGGDHFFGSPGEESFLRAAFRPNENRWVVTGKGGVRYVFGDGGPETRTGGGVGNAATTFAWGLTRIEDPNGNFVAVTYADHGVSSQLNRELYPSRIEYGANSNPAASAPEHLFSVTMSYAVVDGQGPTLRPDRVETYLPGFASRLDYLVRAIFVDYGAQRLRTYRFLYEPEPQSRVSRLVRVTARAEGPEAPPLDLPATEFVYDDASSGFLPAQSWPVSPGLDAEYLRRISAGQIESDQFDLNGDGLIDRLATSHNSNTAWRGSGAGFQPFSSPVVWDPGGGWIVNGGLTKFMDMNGDGLPDKLVLSNSEWSVGFNTGRGWAELAPWPFTTATTPSTTPLCRCAGAAATPSPQASRPRSTSTTPVPTSSIGRCRSPSAIIGGRHSAGARWSTTAAATSP